MRKYAILLNPGHNRVYYKESEKLAIAELEIASAKLHAPCSEIQIETIADMPYCTLCTAQPVDAHDIDVLSRLSFLFVLFEVTDYNGNLHLLPIQAVRYQYIKEKITTILKYKGKTNELFTKMMVNIAWLCANPLNQVRLLDPMAGKGTTLFEGIVRGFDVYGIDASRHSVHDGCVFLKKYLETERIKHITKKRTINSASKKAVGKATAFEYANSKEAFAAQNIKTVEMIDGDASLANVYFKKGFFDMIVSDLPYGVQHTNKKGTAIARSPQELLEKCLPTWANVLKKGGVVVLAWNTNVFGKNKMTELLRTHGFTPLHQDAVFSHFVDVSIQRDIVIAQKS